MRNFRREEMAKRRKRRERHKGISCDSMSLKELPDWLDVRKRKARFVSPPQQDDKPPYVNGCLSKFSQAIIGTLCAILAVYSAIVVLVALFTGRIYTLPRYNMNEIEFTISDDPFMFCIAIALNLGLVYVLLRLVIRSFHALTATR